MSTENIMHAYLIIGNEIDKKIEEILARYQVKPIYTTILIPSPSHGIAAVRQIRESLVIRITGIGEYRAIIIKDAHLMTTQAQNAFLKTLEEPPPDTIIILTSPKEDLMLPTIISRCTIISTQVKSQNINFEEEEKIFQKLSNGSIGEKIQFVEEMGKDRQKALNFVEQQLKFFHQQIHAPTPEVEAQTEVKINAFISARQDISNNVNPKMVLFELLRNYGPF